MSVIYGMPHNDYLLSPALSKSKLAAFIDLEDQQPEESAAMKLGTLAHCAILEPDEIGKRYKVTDLERVGTKAWAEEEKESGRILVKRQEYESVLLMARCLHEHPEAGPLLKTSHKEVSAFWVDEETKLECKARADFISHLGFVIGDIKTCVSVKPEKFRRDFYQRRYDLQDVWYKEGFSILYERPYIFLFFAVEKTAKLLAGSTAKRHAIGVFELDDVDALRAIEEIKLYRRMYAYSMRTGDWPGYPTGPIKLTKPAYMLRDEE